MQLHSLAEPLEIGPEFGPGVAQVVAHGNGIVVDGFFVLHVERHANRGANRAILELRQKVR